MTAAELAKVIVKVGISSDTVFYNVKALRALTFKEVQLLLDANPDVKAIVIEDIRDKEKDLALNILKNIQSNISVVFYYKNQTDTNKEICHELNETNTRSLQEVHTVLTNRLGINVGMTLEQTNVVPDTTNELTEALTAINENIKYAEQIEHPTIQNKDDLEDLLEVIEKVNNEGLENNSELSIDDYKEKTSTELISTILTLKSEKDAFESQAKQALDRVQLLLDMQEVLKDERDSFKKMLDDINSDDNIIEDPILESDMIALQAELDKYKNLDIEKQGRIEKLTIQLDGLNTIIEGYKVEVLGYTTKINQLNDYIKELESKQSDTKNKERLAELETINTQNSIELLEANARIDIEALHRLTLTELLHIATNEIKVLKSSIEEKIIEIEKAATSVKNLTDSLDSRELEFQQLKNKFDELNDLYAIETQKLNSENIANSAKLIELNSELSITKEKLEKSQNELKNRKNELERLSKQEVSTQGIYDNLTDSIKVLKESNKVLLNNIDMQKNEIDELREKLKIADMSIANITETNRQLKGSLLALSRGSSENAHNIKLSCEYAGRAVIIPVFGSGSYGITTTAMSIAKKLPGSVLYMDMDISNPKADGWFNKVPIIAELTGIDIILKKTGLGALIEKGVDYVIQNEKLIFQRVSESKVNHIDYFSGSYTNIDITKLAAVNFTEIMNYLGNTYRYIVVDLGRLGSSEVNNALIRMFDTIAYKSVIVTLKDKFDVRTLAVKANNEKIRVDNSIWLLNLANDTKLDPLIIKSVSKSKTIIMPKVMSMYGNGQTFDKISGTKARLNELLEIIVN